MDYCLPGIDSAGKLNLIKKAASETAPSSSTKNPKSAASRLAAKVERFKQGRKSLSETRIVGGVAINTAVDNDPPLAVQASADSMKSETVLGKIVNKVMPELF